MEAFQESQNIQLPQQQLEAAESTPTRPRKSAERPREPSPAGDRRSDRSHRESLGRQQRDREEQGRVRSRSRHTRATRSGVVELLVTARDNSDNHPRETIHVRGNTVSVFDHLGRPGIHRHLGRKRFVDKPTKVDHDQNKLDHLQQQLDQLVGQQYGFE